jgi:protein-S-isoprenylcysteine O-methyltransferase Ste14
VGEVATTLPEVRPEVVRGETPAARIGALLFKVRGFTPIPFYLAGMFLPWGREPRWMLAWAVGLPLIALGEAIRFWSIAHIGRSARTRKVKGRKLVASGPYALVRNPLYVGNVAIYLGITAASGLFWLVPVTLVWFALQYHCIVAWEEGILRERQGEAYVEYTSLVPRWVPRWPAEGLGIGPGYPLSEILFRERDSLLGVVGVTLLLAAREWARQAGWF